MGGDEITFLRRWVVMEEKLGGDGGMDMKCAGTGGDGCNFCPRAGL